MEDYHSDLDCKKCGANEGDEESKNLLRIRHVYKHGDTPEHLAVTCLRCLYKWEVKVYLEEES